MADGVDGLAGWRRNRGRRAGEVGVGWEKKKNGFGVELGVAVLAGEKKEKKSDEGGGLVSLISREEEEKKNQKMGVGWPDAEGKKKSKGEGLLFGFKWEADGRREKMLWPSVWVCGDRKSRAPGGKNKSKMGDREGEKGVSVFCFQAVVRRRSKSPEGGRRLEKKSKSSRGWRLVLSGEGAEKVQLLGFLFCVPSPPKITK